jgi:hypothetical protein
VYLCVFVNLRVGFDDPIKIRIENSGGSELGDFRGDQLALNLKIISNGHKTYHITNTRLNTNQQTWKKEYSIKAKKNYKSK